MAKDNKERREVLSIFVDNQANVLTRVVSLFGRRGFNIDSLTVSATNDPEISRITVVFVGTERSLQQIITQTEKLEVVKKVFILEKESSLYRELLLMKIMTDKDERSKVLEIVDRYRGRIIDMAKHNLIVELTGEPSKIDHFINMVDCYEISEVCRTGMTAMEDGWSTEMTME